MVFAMLNAGSILPLLGCILATPYYTSFLVNIKKGLLVWKKGKTGTILSDLLLYPSIGVLQ